MATGQNPNDPLTVLNGPMGHGLMAGFNPFQGMGVNLNDPNMVRLQNIWHKQFPDDTVWCDL
jgi:ubiquilin